MGEGAKWDVLSLGKVSHRVLQRYRRDEVRDDGEPREAEDEVTLMDSILFPPVDTYHSARRSRIRHSHKRKSSHGRHNISKPMESEIVLHRKRRAERRHRD
jgi:hypothetical protein